MAEQVKPLSESLENERRVILIGKTGDGKSATGNTMLGQTVFTSELKASSVTRKCKQAEAKRFGKSLIVMDTPGFFDIQMTNDEVTKEIVKCIGMTSPGPHAIVLVMKIERYTKVDQDTVKLFSELFGKTIYKHMVVVFTGRDYLERLNTTVQNFVQDEHFPFKALFGLCDNRYLAFDNSLEQASERRDKDAENFMKVVDKVIAANGGRCFSNKLFVEVERLVQQKKDRLQHQMNDEIEQIDAEIEKMRKRRDEIEKQYLRDIEDVRSKFRTDLENEKEGLFQNVQLGLYNILLGLWNVAKTPFVFVGSFVFPRK